MEKKTSISKEGFITGFALFATFFGAGNLIFPPDIGFHVGDQWIIGSLGLLLTGIILPVLAVFAVSNTGGTPKYLMDHVSPWFYNLFYLLTTTLIGMGSTMPRVAATTHEMGISNIFPNVPIYVTVIAFFIVLYLLANDQNTIVDKVGKYLTPALLILLLIIIIKTFIVPIGTPQPHEGDNPFTYAMLTGYLTGDLTTGIITAFIFLSHFVRKGFNRQETQKGVSIAGIVAIIGLFIIYGGLTYLGAQATDLTTEAMGKAELLTFVVRESLGQLGLTLLGIAVALACLTTGIGISATVANFLAEFSNDKISYKKWMVVICIVGAVLGSTGVDQIVDYVTPIFMIVYPICIVLTFLGVLNKYVPNDGVYKGGILMAFIFSIGDALLSVGYSPDWLLNLTSYLPLSELGFTWLIPTIIGMIVGGIVGKDTGKIHEGEWVV